MQYMYRPTNTCSKEIYFSVDDDHTVHNVRFVGGCDGNLKALMKLFEGMKAEDIIAKMQGITCSKKNTSCPDQFSLALKALLERNTK